MWLIAGACLGAGRDRARGAQAELKLRVSYYNGDSAGPLPPAARALTPGRQDDAAVDPEPAVVAPLHHLLDDLFGDLVPFALPGFFRFFNSARRIRVQVAYLLEMTAAPS